MIDVRPSYNKTFILFTDLIQFSVRPDGVSGAKWKKNLCMIDLSPPLLGNQKHFNFFFQGFLSYWIEMNLAEHSASLSKSREPMIYYWLNNQIMGLVHNELSQNQTNQPLWFIRFMA